MSDAKAFDRFCDELVGALDDSNLLVLIVFAWMICYAGREICPLADQLRARQIGAAVMLAYFLYRALRYSHHNADELLTSIVRAAVFGYLARGGLYLLLPFWHGHYFRRRLLRRILGGWHVRYAQWQSRRQYEQELAALRTAGLDPIELERAELSLKQRYLRRLQEMLS